MTMRDVGYIVALRGWGFDFTTLLEPWSEAYMAGFDTGVRVRREMWEFFTRGM